MKTLITNATVLTMNDDTVLHNACIAIQDDKITFIGNNGAVDTVFKPDNVINADKKLVMPGLVNAHTHVGMALLRNYADDLFLEDWLFKKIFPAERKFEQIDVYWSAMLCIAEMIKTGTTCFGDMYFFEEQIAKAVDETGIRANLSVGMTNNNTDFDVASDRDINAQTELYNNWHGKADGRIRVSAGPHSVYTTTLEYLKACAELAKQLSIGIHIHILETDTEKQNSIRNFGVTSVEHCVNAGIFDVPVIAAHSIHLNSTDMDIYAQKNASAVHCPGSNLKLGSGVAPIAELVSKDINVCLGTDSVASNNNLDMFEEIRLAATIHKGVHRDAQLVTAYDALKMATVNGARALAFYDDLGILKVGMKADLIILDIDKINYYPHHDIISAIAYSANSSDVDTVIVNGRVLMEKRELTTVDEEKVKYNIKKLAMKLM